MKKYKRQENGITLVALVITIIVMIILVGVTITVAIKGGLFDVATKAAKDTQAKTDEEILLSAVAGAINRGKLDYTILDSNLPAGFTGSLGRYTSENGNSFIVGEDGKITLIDGDVHQKVQVSDLVEPVRDKTTVYMYPNAEKYYPELVEEALIKFINKNAGASAKTINEAKQVIIDLPNSQFAGKTPEEISNNMLVEAFGATSQNDFMNKQGYIYMMTSPEDKRECLIEQNRVFGYVLIITLSKDNPDELARAEALKNMSINEYLENYIIPNYDILAGRTGESITADEFASILKDNTLNSTTVNEYWDTEILENINETVSSIALQVKLKDFKTEIISSNNILGSFANIFYLRTGENGTYKFKAYNDNYITTKNIEVSGI